MEDFKQYLSEQPDESERTAAQQVEQGLAGWRLENKVAEVALARKTWLRKRVLQRALWMGLLLVVTGIAIFYFAPKKETLTLPNTEKTAPITPNNTPEEAPIQHKQEAPPLRPMAQHTPKQNPSDSRFSAPIIRGENTDNTAWQARVNQIWQTDYQANRWSLGPAFAESDRLLKAGEFEAAYVKIQRLERKMSENDTLSYLKAYCLLEMGEGNEAAKYFTPLMGRHPNWDPQIEWYLGLSKLLTGDRVEALNLFQKMASQPKHPFRAQSQKAIRVLQ